MICPYCGVDKDRVVDSRSADNGGAIRRRRECLVCTRRFTTYERADKTARLKVVKRDGSRVDFDPQSILRGVMAACGKRPIPEDSKVAIMREVEDTLHREFDREVTSDEIGRRVAGYLRELDLVAYIRFASEHYRYRTAEEMARELHEQMSRPVEYRDQGRLFTDEKPPPSDA